MPRPHRTKFPGAQLLFGVLASVSVESFRVVPVLPPGIRPPPGALEPPWGAVVPTLSVVTAGVAALRPRPATGLVSAPAGASAVITAARGSTARERPAAATVAS
ncbi:hypothetical protein D9V30_09665 [Mycetocola reblochoni]|uniref:Uncharacterized protein n=1 Tax=Mycetocola reblochoni TaxID=331618 RepID=A0A3L6ZMP0_9MICO|nr:hypothetical protein D9V30_09665 [Mycetocola reblochoni]